MFRNLSLAALLVLTCVPGASAQEWAKKMFKVTSHDFGTVARGATAEYKFEFTNLYVEDVHVLSVRSSCGCATPSIENDSLKTFEKSSIVARYNTGSFLGQKAATITVTLDKPFFAEIQLQIKGYIRGDVVMSPGKVDLGTVQEGAGSESKVTLSYAGREDWKIVDVRTTSKSLGVKLKETSRGGGMVQYDLNVVLDKDAPAGSLQDQLTIITDDQTTRTIPLAVEGRVTPSLTVSPSSLFLGVLNPGDKVTKTLIVRGKTPFRVTSVECSDGSFEFKTSEDAKELHVIPVTFTAGNQQGQVAQPIEIKTSLNSTSETKCVATATIK